MKTNKSLILTILIIMIAFISKGEAKKSKRSAIEGLIKGIVFLDIDQNGIKSHFEKGVSGVKIILSNGQKVLTDNNGKFRIHIKSEEQNLKIHVEPHSVPAGSKFTTSSNSHLNLGTLKVFNINFGVNYSQHKHVFKMGKVPSKKQKLIKVNNNIKVDLSIKEGKISINKRHLFTIKNDQNINNEDYIYKKYHLKKYDSISPWNNNELSLLLEKIYQDQDNLREITVIRHYFEKDPLSKQKAQILAGKIAIEIEKKSFKNSETKIELRKGKTKTEIKVTYVKPLIYDKEIKKTCDFNLAGQDSITLSNNGQIFFEYDENKSNFFNLNCDNTLYVFSINAKENKNIDGVRNFEIMSTSHSTIKKLIFSAPAQLKYTINKEYEYQGNEIQTPILEIQHSKHIKDSRDLDLNFSIQSKNLKSLLINDIPSTEIQTNFTLKAKRKLSTIKIEAETLENKYYRFDYPIYLKFDSSFIFKIEWQQHRISAKSDFQNTQYKLSATPNLSTNIEYWKDSNWGANLVLSQDLVGTELKTFRDKSVYEKHSKHALYLLNRFWNNYKEFFSSKYIFHIGLLKKDFATNQKTLKIFTPKSFIALSAGLTYKKHSFLYRFLDLESKLFYSISSKLNGDYFFETNHYIKIDLNKIGKILQIKPSYRFYNRYFPFDHLKFVIGAGYEFFRVGIKRNAKGKLHEKNYHLNLGLEFSI